MSADFAAWRLAVAETVVRSGRRARLAVRGGSMLPLLREPMVVEVAALRRPARLGEILVFTEGENYVVHRVVARRVAGYVTAGDANGSRTEEVAEDAILGRVEAVWSDASPSARRVDGLRFRLRGAWYTHGRPLRLALWRVLARIRSIQHAS